MERESYERLSSQDSSFLMFEHRSTPMHVAAVSIFDAGPLSTEGGGVDVERIAKYTESRLHLLPRYRQRLARSPISQHPVWVDDEHFELSFHLRHTSLPRPGDEAALKRLVGRLVSLHLDRQRPLWEMWVVEGLEGNRFALVSKVHHCMVDGAAGVNILSLLMSPEPDSRIDSAPAWTPQTPPSAIELATDELRDRLAAPGRALGALGTALRDPIGAGRGAAESARSVFQALRDGLQRLPETPLNRRIGAHRLMDWHTLDLAEVKAVRRALGGTVNDVILATVAGAVRRFLGSRGALAELSRHDFRVMMPVNMRSGADDMTAANHVSGLFLSLPADEPDAAVRYSLVRQRTRELKSSHAAAGIDLLIQLADGTRSASLMRLGVALASRIKPYNLIVTNVPGPQMPLYMLGSRLQAIYPQVPLFHGQGLGVAVMSYDGKVCWGLVGDWEVLPDLPRFGEAVEASFRELEQAAASSA